MKGSQTLIIELLDIGFNDAAIDRIEIDLSFFPVLICAIDFVAVACDLKGFDFESHFFDWNSKLYCRYDLENFRR